MPESIFPLLVFESYASGTDITHTRVAHWSKRTNMILAIIMSPIQNSKLAEWLPLADQEFKNSLLPRLVTFSSNFTSSNSYMFQINIGN